MESFDYANYPHNVNDVRSFSKAKTFIITKYCKDNPEMIFLFCSQRNHTKPL